MYISSKAGKEVFYGWFQKIFPTSVFVLSARVRIVPLSHGIIVQSAPPTDRGRLRERISPRDNDTEPPAQNPYRRLRWEGRRRRLRSAASRNFLSCWEITEHPLVGKGFLVLPDECTLDTSHESRDPPKADHTSLLLAL